MLEELDVISIDGGLARLLLADELPHLVAQSSRRISRKARQVTTITAMPNKFGVSLIVDIHTGRVGLPLIATSRLLPDRDAVVCIRPNRITLQVAERS